MTIRSIAPADELCIFYGSKLWFDDRSGTPALAGDDDEDEDPLVRLANIEWDQANEGPNELAPEAKLPFEGVGVTEPEGDEEGSSGVGETSLLFRLLHLDIV